MSQRIKVNQIVPFGFGAVFFLMIGITASTKLYIHTLVDAAEWVAHTYKIKAELNTLEKYLVDAETGQRGFLITGQENFLDPYQRAIGVINDTFEDLRQEIKNNPNQLRRIDAVEKSAKQKLDGLKTTIALKKSGKEKEAFALVLSGKGNDLMDTIRTQIAEMIQVEEELLAERQKAALQAEQTLTIVSFGGTFIAIVCGTFISRFIAQSIMRPINEAVTLIANSSAEIATTVEQQERTAAQQAVSVHQTTTTMDELGASSKATAQQAESAATGVQQALKLTEGGTQAVGQTLEEMAMLKQKVEAIAQQILCLSEQTHQIGSISSLVSDLANQTNMLALNAAVEAVRAGEHGRGFAVVASEIRKLADQSKKSAQGINSLVADIQNAINVTVMVTDEGTKTVDLGVKTAQETAKVFTGVTDAINNVVLNSQQISLNAQQQAVAIQQVVDAMNHLNQGAIETAGSITRIKGGTRNLNEAALDLKTLV